MFDVLPALRLRWPSPYFSRCRLALVWSTVLFVAGVPLMAQVNAISGRWATARVSTEETRYLQQAGRLTPEEARARTATINTELGAIQTLLRTLPREVQAEITQQQETLFQTRIVPLRQQWAEALAQKQRADQARFAELTKELQTDAAATGKLQAERTVLRERAQRGEVSQSEASRSDQQAEQQILSVRRKYDALDDERARIGQRPYWATTFSRTEAAYAARSVAELRLRARLDDKESPVGKDAQQAAALTLSIQRNQFLQSQQAMSPPEAQSLNANAQAALAILQQKYAASPDAADYRDRVARLVQEGAVAQRPQWERDVTAAREEAARRAAAAAQPPPQATPRPVTPQPSAVPTGDPLARPGDTSAPAPKATTRPRTTGPARPAPQPQRAPQRTIFDGQLPRPVASSGGIPWSTVLIVLLVGGGGAGFYMMRARKAATPPAFAAAPAISAPEPDAHSNYAFASAPTPATAATPSTATATPAATGLSLKEQLFAQQREKYQNRYNDALDEVTQATAALTLVAPLLATAHANLVTLSKSLYDRVYAAMVARYGGALKAVFNAMWLRPVWRLFGQLGLLGKIAIGVAVWLLFGYLVRSLQAGEYAFTILLYGAIVAAGFFIERRLVLKAPLALLKRNEAELKTAQLLYTFAEQRPEVINGASGFRGMWLQSTDPVPIAHDNAYEASVGSGVLRLQIGKLAMFRVESSGTIAPIDATQANQLVREHGDVLTGVVTNLGDFGQSTVPPIVQYGQVLWRRNRAAAQLPQLEALVRDVDRIESLWRDTYVSDEVFQFLFRSIDMFNMRDAATPPGLLLCGMSGNGRKHLATKIAETISARFEQVTPSKIASADHIAALWEASRGSDPVVLFVPNAETVFPKIADGTSAANTLEWIAEWEKHEPRESRVWVVMTAKSDDAVDPAIIDHVGRDSTIEIQSPDGAGRLQLLQMAGRLYQVTAMPSEALQKTMGGVSVQDLRRIVMAAKRAASPGQPQDTHWKQAIQTVRGADAKFKDETKTWDRLILPAAIKDQLKLACKVLQDAQEYKKKGLEIPKVLLYGPPGTGKTEIARTIANEAGVNFMEGSLAKMKGKHIGESGQMVTDLFAKARATAPTVLFIDEIDAVAKQRGDSSSDSFTEDIVNVLLTELEGAANFDRPVFILAATNLPDAMDDAILKRFRRKIEIPLPDEGARQAMLQGFLRERRDAIDFDIDEMAKALAKRTDGQAGRQLRDLVRTAFEQAQMIAEAASPPGDVRLTRELLFESAELLVREGSDGVDPSARWDTLVASDATLAQLREVSDALRHMETLQKQGIEPPRGAVLWGPPGTGKTQIAKTLANESGVRFLLKSPSDVGQTAGSVRALFNEARSKAPCILFIDEFENAGRSREQGGSAEVVTELLSQMQGAKKDARPVFVLAATNYLTTVDDAILSRFTYRIEVPNPSVEQREKLFRIFLNKVPHEGVDVDAVSAELARKGGGLAGRDINDVIVRASQAAAQRAVRAGTPDQVRLTHEDLTAEVAEMLKTRNVGVDPDARWNTLVISDDTLRTLKQVSTALRNMEDRLKQGVAPPRGAVLFGPPGTGKTQIAKTLANESGVNYHFATAKDLVGQFVGESPQKVAKLFAEARKKAPCLLFLDEFESAAASRSGSKGSGFKDEVVPQLLAEMDGAVKTGRAVFVLAATNYLEQLDPAVVSRFTYQIEVPNPTQEQRERLFTVFLQKVRRVDFDVPSMAAELAKRSGEIAGRQIHDLVEQALQDAAQRADEAGGGEIVLRREDLMRRFEPKGRAVSDEDLTSVWSQIVLEPKVKDSLTSMIRLFNSGSKAAPRGLLLWGPPGTGKTEIARLVAKSTGCQFLSTDLSKLKGSYVGESGKNVRELWEKARTSGRAVIFVDECDGVFARRGGVNTDAAVEEINNAFLPMWDGLESKGQIWVIGATNKRDRIDEAMTSRFGEMIEIGLPGPAERTAILRLEMQKLESSIAVPETVGPATSGFSGRNLSKLASSVFRKAAAQGGVASDDIWKQAIQELATATTDRVDESAAWGTLILPEPIIKRLKRISSMLGHAETLRAQGAEVPRAALLYGPPGTGKTQIAKTLANESKLNFISASPSDIKGAHLGESGKLVKELFERARSKPTVLFIDEIESTAASRNGGRGDQYTIEIVNELLTQMEGVKKTDGTVFVLAATNYPNLIDEAVLSRFEDRIEIPNPGPEERKRMLKTFIGKRRVDFEVDAVAEELGPTLDGLSGRALMALIRRASQQSAERAIDAGTPDQIVMSRQDLVGALSVTGE